MDGVMGKRGVRGNNFFNGFKNFKGRGNSPWDFIRRANFLSSLTPAKCCVALVMLLTLLFLGVGFTGIIIMALLLIIFVLVC
ncbi:fatty acid desaturase [Clostridium moniliforme]|uniref:Fatty acid desaturase n=2 Tax=Clostridium moniliforme TaxID=39489 RepID=A0ABS4EZX9_9CLOT|nr:fatty acid desaturase [Clostridium moniliforme]